MKHTIKFDTPIGDITIIAETGGDSQTQAEIVVKRFFYFEIQNYMSTLEKDEVEEKEACEKLLKDLWNDLEPFSALHMPLVTLFERMEDDLQWISGPDGGASNSIKINKSY